MKTLIAVAIVCALIAIWVLWLRPWMRDRDWARGFFSAIEPIEITLWRKSETILWARLKMLVGVLLAVLTSLGGIDLTPLMPFVPDQYEGLVRVAFNLLPLVITAIGWIDEKLRRDTTKPLEVVALPEDQPPEVAAAVARVEVANMVAVETVKIAKAEGDV